jgi:DNA replication protein DnaC
MTYNIQADFLSDEEAARLADRFPQLGVEVGPWDYCPTCNTEKKYRLNGVDHECDCRAQLQLYRHYLNSGVGDLYHRLDWGDFYGDRELAVSIRENYLGHSYIDQGMGLFLWGDMGTGKTMLATLVIKDLIKRGVKCYAITVEDLIDEFTKGWASDDDKRWYERKIKYSEVLLLDDLGKERNRGSLPQSTFNGLLRSRVQGGRPTLITTNLSIEQVTNTYGTSSMSLLYEQSLAEEFRGEDQRSEARARKVLLAHAGERRPIV